MVEVLRGSLNPRTKACEVPTPVVPTMPVRSKLILIFERFIIWTSSTGITAEGEEQSKCRWNVSWGEGKLY